MDQQNADGSWSPATPLEWQPVPGGDWEVYRSGRLWIAELYDKDNLLTVVTSYFRLILVWKMRRARKLVGV